jgi:hypothetical protein
MKQRIVFVISLVGLATVLGATVFRDQVAWAAQSVDAHITNLDASGNVKVHEQGTADVHVSGGAVGLDASANTVKLDQSNGPLPVTVKDNPAFQTVVRTKDFTMPEHYLHWVDEFSVVPPGKELVIEQMAFQAEFPFGQEVLQAEFQVLAGGVEDDSPIPPTHVAAFLGFTHSMASLETRVYADPGSHVYCFVRRTDGAGSGYATCSFSGHLVTLPQS